MKGQSVGNKYMSRKTSAKIKNCEKKFHKNCENIFSIKTSGSIENTGIYKGC
jgi:hypothetical protein